MDRPALVETTGGPDGFEAAATDTTGATKGDPRDTGPGVMEIFKLRAASPGAVEFACPALAAGAETVTGAVRDAGGVDLAGPATTVVAPPVFDGKGTNVRGAPGGGIVIGFATAVVLTGVMEAILTGSNTRRTTLSRTRFSGTGCAFPIASIPSIDGTLLNSRN